MLQNSIVVRKRHEKFLEELISNKVVWALQATEGFATSSSNTFEDRDGNSIKMICFWSNKKLAKVCARGAWKAYSPTEISLDRFLEDWCIGMYYDQLLIGTNFDWNMFGFEIEPLELAFEIIEKLKAKDLKIDFKKYDDMEDFEQRIKDNITGN